MEWIEVARAIALGDHPSGLQIHHKTTSGVKFNRTIVVGSKIANENKILNKTRGNKNIIKTYGTGKVNGAIRGDGK